MSLPAIFGIVISILFIIYSFLKTSSLINPVIPVGIIWIVILILSFTNQKLTVPDNKIYWIIDVGLFSYFLGAMIFFGISKGHKIYHPKHYIPNYLLLDILAIICIFFFVRQHAALSNTANISNLGDTQKALQAGVSTGGSQLDGTLMILFVNPVSFAIPAITAADFWFGRKNKTLFFLTVILVIVKVMATANRTSIFVFFLWLIVLGLLKNRVTIKDSLKHASKWKIAIIGIASIFVLSLLSISRGTSLIESINMELAIPPRMFEIWKNTVDSSQFYSYGLSSFMGLIHPITYVLNHTLGLSTPTLVTKTFNLIQLTDTSWVWPGPHVTANAYVSFLWFFYTDFRIPGIIIFSLFSGAIAMSIFKKVRSSDNLKLLAIYCLIFYALFYSFVRMQTANDTFVLGLVFIWLFAFRKVS